MEQVYAPHVSGLGTMEATRQFLVSKGMTPHFAGLLASKYIKGLEEKSVSSLIDLFSSKTSGFETLQALAEAPMKAVAVNYLPIGQLS